MQPGRSSQRQYRIGAIFCLSLVLLLTGCQGVSFSPTDAAARSILENHMPDFSVDPNSIEVLQQVEAGSMVIVMLRFSGVRATSGQEECLYAQSVEKANLLGWRATSGGGGCSSAKPDPDIEPISIGASRASGSRIGDPGHSEVYGEVYNEAITSVQVTWKDGKTQIVDVANHSYLAARDGQFDMQSVEGLDSDGQVIHTNEPIVAPGKQ